MKANIQLQQKSMNQRLICTSCGTQFNTDFDKNANCPICSDDRQYVPEIGQSWTTLESLRQNHCVLFRKLNDRLYELSIIPTFAIGQRALLVLTPRGNILWDCISLLDEPIIELIKSKGGLKAIAFSHPHYYTIMNEWANTFRCPIYIHESDKRWIFNKGEHITLWGGTEKELWGGLKIFNIGGHFPGSSILHIPFLSPKGTILCGDTFYISPNKKHMAPMYSYPNKIPLPVSEVNRIKMQMRSIEFDSMLGFYDFQNIYGNAKEILEASLNKYV